MSKCSLCNTRKGKRKCPDTATFICSLCCGSSRTEQKCASCQFYKESYLNRNYFKLPYFEPEEIVDDDKLKSISEFIEKSLCIVDNDHHISDDQAMRILEYLLDKYHYNDNTILFDNPVGEEGFLLVNKYLEKKHNQLPQDILIKVISTVMRSIRRHKAGNRGYMDFIQQFVDF